jgi:ABC-2 type transport system permease protein
MALASLTVVPRRTRLLLAKTLVVAVYGALLTAMLAPVCVLAAVLLTGVPGGIPFLAPEVLRPVGLQVGAAALVGVLSVGLGAALRSTAGAVGLGIALVSALPPVLALSGSSWASTLSQALPALRVGEDPFLAVSTTWPVGMGVVAGWAVVLWGIGAVMLARRDV